MSATAMKFEIVEPAPRKVQNAEKRREIASRVYQCSKWLRIQGFNVVAAVGGVHQAHIFIEHDELLCSQLDGVTEGYERTRLGEFRFRFVVRFGVVVKWVVA